MQEIHLKFFAYQRGVLSKWVDMKDPDFDAETLDKPEMLKKLIDFPYRPEGWPLEKAFTKKDFDEMPLEDCYKMVMSGVINEA